MESPFQSVIGPPTCPAASDLPSGEQATDTTPKPSGETHQGPAAGRLADPNPVVGIGGNDFARKAVRRTLHGGPGAIQGDAGSGFRA